MHKIIYYRNKCIGCGICCENHPDIWAMSKKDGKAVLLNASSKKDIYSLSVNAEAAALCQFLVKACPVNIIKIR
ncbi:MAG: ferredoxin [Daejeonella sp.]